MTKNNEGHIAAMVATICLALFFGAAAGYWKGSSLASESARDIEAIYKDAVTHKVRENARTACFGIGDLDVYTIQFYRDGSMYRAIWRSNGTHFYWQDTLGNWGISEDTPRFPWLGGNHE